MILVRNCPHNNGIHTLIHEEQSLVLKSSYSNEAIIRLKHEHLGYDWYFRQTNMSNNWYLNYFENSSGVYSRLSVRLFYGSAGECYKNISYNRKNILRVINYYKDVWPSSSKKSLPIHGDFSLGNIIFSKKSLAIIDWEHFKIGAAPWGFDLVNLLYEAIFFSFNNAGNLTKTDKETFLELRKVMILTLVKGESFNCSLDVLTNFIEKNYSIWGVFKSKLPVMNFSKAQREVILELEK